MARRGLHFSSLSLLYFNRFERSQSATPAALLLPSFSIEALTSCGFILMSFSDRFSLAMSCTGDGIPLLHGFYTITVLYLQDHFQGPRFFQLGCFPCQSV